MPSRPKVQHTDAPLFTAESVHALLQKVITVNSTRPQVRRRDPACTILAGLLNTLRLSAEGWVGPFAEEEANANSLAQALGCIVFHAPSIIDYLEKQIETSIAARRQYSSFFENDNEAREVEAKMVSATQRDLEAWRTLYNGAVAVEGVPLSVNSLLVRIERWEQVATIIASSLRRWVHHISDGSVYAFIVEVIPSIVGHSVTTSQVKKSFHRSKERAKEGGDKPD